MRRAPAARGLSFGGGRQLGSPTDQLVLGAPQHQGGRVGLVGVGAESASRPPIQPAGGSAPISRLASRTASARRDVSRPTSWSTRRLISS